MPVATKANDGRYSILGVEILRVGTWNGRTYSRDDLEQIVAAHDELSAAGILVPRITIDHDEEATRRQAHGPALGFVDRLDLRGDVLLADLIKVPAALARAIERENYADRSVEVWFQSRIAGREFPAFMSAVTFLGADVPAVDGLRGVDALYEEPAAVLASEHSERVLLRASDFVSPVEVPNVDLSKIRGALGLGDDADEGAVLSRLEELAAPSVALSSLREALKLEDDADGEAVLSAIGDLLSAKTEAASLRAELSRKGGEDATELGQLREQVVKLQKDAAKRDAEATVDGLIREGKLLPKQRESMVKGALRDSEWFAEFSATLDVVVDTTERGTSTEPDADGLTAEERAAAESVGVTVEEYKAALAAAGGGEG